MRLLVLHEKHYDRYFAVPTDKELHKMCIKILKERLAAGWYNPGPKPEEFEMSPEAIKTLPAGRFKTEVSRLQEENRVKIRNWNSSQEFKEKVIKAIKEPFPKNGQNSFTDIWVGGKRIPKRVTCLKTYILLSDRNEFEYERVSLEETEN